MIVPYGEQNVQLTAAEVDILRRNSRLTWKLLSTRFHWTTRISATKRYADTR